MTHLNDLVQILGSANVLTGADADSYVEDWRGRYRGRALAVARPGSTREVDQVIKWCIANKMTIVLQGGNTGLCVAATHVASGSALVLSLGRLNRIRGIDTDNVTMEVEAGCILQQV